MGDRFVYVREEIYSVKEWEDIIQAMRPAKASSRITLVYIEDTSLARGLKLLYPPDQRLPLSMNSLLMDLATI